MATQLRRYEVDPDRLDELAQWFPSIAKVREQYGFTIDFAYIDRDTNQFIWSVSHPDWDSAIDTYEQSPERAAAFEGFESPVKAAHIAMVDQVI